MKRIFTFIQIFLLVCGTVYAGQVDVKRARAGGQKFLVTKTVSPKFTTVPEVQLVYTATAPSTDASGAVQVHNCYYVFNLGRGEGFIIVSADDQIYPILAWSDQGAFNEKSIPPHVDAWLQTYSDQITYTISNNVPATDGMRSDWNGNLCRNPEISVRN